jgi:putative hydrolase of the HAD superfamily
MNGPRVDAVLFDYGGVLTGPVNVSIRAWLEADGIDPASFSSTLKQWLSRTVEWVTPIHRLETGELAIADFEEVFAEALRTVDGRPIDASGILDRMFAQMRPDPAMFELVEALRDQGIKVGLLSNSWGNPYPRERIDALFDPVVISGEVGLRKPQPEIYRHALDLLDVTPGRTLFVDDGEPNIHAAQALGLRALLHTTPQCTSAALAAMVPDLTDSLKGVSA